MRFVFTTDKKPLSDKEAEKLRMIDVSIARKDKEYDRAVYYLKNDMWTNAEYNAEIQRIDEFHLNELNMINKMYSGNNWD